MVRIPTTTRPVKGEITGKYLIENRHQSPRAPKQQNHQMALDENVVQDFETFYWIGVRNGKIEERMSPDIESRLHKSAYADCVRRFQDAVLHCSNVRQEQDEDNDDAASTIRRGTTSSTERKFVSTPLQTANSVAPLYARHGKRRGSGGHEGQRQRRRTARGPQKMLEIEVGDREKMVQWIMQAFDASQQVACRIVAKLWIKKIHPKKQSTNPYNGAVPRDLPRDPERTKPSYWPRDVEHKEPDHIPKTARIKLLVHLLLSTPIPRIVDPKDGKHKEDCQIMATDLEDQTKIKKGDIDPSKWAILEAIFRARTMMEKYEDRQIDGDAVIFVPACDSETRQENGETQADIEDDDPGFDRLRPVVSEDEDDDADSGVLPLLTPDSPALPSPMDESTHTLHMNDTYRSETSSFSEPAAPAEVKAEPLRQTFGMVPPSAEHSSLAFALPNYVPSSMAYAHAVLGPAVCSSAQGPDLLGSTLEHDFNTQVRAERGQRQHEHRQLQERQRQELQHSQAYQQLHLKQQQQMQQSQHFANSWIQPPPQNPFLAFGLDGDQCHPSPSHTLSMMPTGVSDFMPHPAQGQTTMHNVPFRSTPDCPPYQQYLSRQNSHDIGVDPSGSFFSM